MVRLGTQIGGLVTLTHLLPASDFGLIAMASIVTGLASLFRDFGTTAAVIQRQELTDQLLDSVFWFNLAIGLTLAVFIGLSAPLMARLFSEPRLVGVLVLLSIAFPVGSLGLVHQALLERASAFRPVALVESTASLLGLGAALWGGWSGWGAYSLVAQTLVPAGANTVGFWLVSRWRPTSRGSVGQIKGLMRFTGNLVGFNTFNYFARNADNMLVGRLLGAAELGYYTMAYRLMLWPLQNISAVVGRALFPVLSQMQTDHNRLGSVYIKATAAITLISAPIMLGLFVLRQSFVEAVLGPRWFPVSDLLMWLAPIGLIESIGTTVGSIYLALGRTDLLFRWGLFASTLVMVSFGVGIQWGLQGLVIGYAIASCLLFIPSLIIPYGLIGLKIQTVFRAVLPSLGTATLMAIGLIITRHFMLGAEMTRLHKFGFTVIIGTLTYGLLTLLVQSGFVRNLLNTLKER